MLQFATRGWKAALKNDAALALGLNVHEGMITHPAVAQAFPELKYVDTQELI